MPIDIKNNYRDIYQIAVNMKFFNDVIIKVEQTNRFHIVVCEMAPRSKMARSRVVCAHTRKLISAGVPRQIVVYLL